MVGMRKEFLLLILIVIACLLLAACKQNVRYHDASAAATNAICERG